MSEKRRKRERERDVLPYKLVTLDVFHLEISPLNALAQANATYKRNKKIKISIQKKRRKKREKRTILLIKDL